jgi:SAM-dependent methyltransferase
LREQIIQLGPWHLEVKVTDALTTRTALDDPDAMYPESYGPVTFRSPEESFKHQMLRVFPEGLAGRAVLDCACNCGAYLFWAKELGAGRCFGFDIRQHWIDQARFLQAHRLPPVEDLTFEVCDLYDVPSLGLEAFDITRFGGIFYHLPDPVSGLKIAADLTQELLIIDTATRNGFPDGLLYVCEEGTHLMSGVYRLAWLPTGPEPLRRILAWLGFPHTRLEWWKTETAEQPAEMGRLELLAAKHEQAFAYYDSIVASRAPQ